MTAIFLIPTEQEKQLLEQEMQENCPHLLAHPIHVIGYGALASACTTATLIEQYRTSEFSNPQYILLGIAGSYNEHKAPLGSTHLFDNIELEGIGVIRDDCPGLITSLPFPQFIQSDEPKTATISSATAEQASRIEKFPASEKTDCLVTVMAASSGNACAQHRLQAHPSAIAEDMESFGVAAACIQASQEWRVLRAISNYVGDRNFANWDIQQSMSNLCLSLDQYLKNGSV